MATVLENLARLGHALPTPHVHADGNHTSALVQGDVIYLGGQIPVTPEGKIITGKVGVDIDLEEACRAAELVAVHLIAQLRHIAQVPLEAVQLCKLTCMVASSPDFTVHHEVADACSEVFYQTMGKRGVGVREGFGVTSLPVDACIEASAIFTLVDKPKGGLFSRR